MLDLFEELEETFVQNEQVADGASYFNNYAEPLEKDLIRFIAQAQQDSPFRQMTTPGGRRMSVTSTSCGPYGWVSDSKGYRYSQVDPANNTPWPEIPSFIIEFARETASKAGYPGFVADSCLLNQYTPGSQLSLHQDKDERDPTSPIVSISLGIPAVFQFGGLQRNSPIKRIRLTHNDVVVWGGASRFYFHGIEPVSYAFHSLLGARRINITLRKAMD